MEMTNYDFGGYATRFDIKCTDGRTIRRGAFEHMDGQTVPLVWGHDHSNPENVIGNGVLNARPDGMYYCANFNNSPRAASAKEAIQHGDINRLSIYANHIKENKATGDVVHGIIREVSLVYAGANDGAVIDAVSFAHDDEGGLEEAIMISDMNIEIEHEDKGEKPKMAERTVQDVIDSMNEEQKAVLDGLNVKMYEKGLEDGRSGNVEHSDDDDDYIEQGDEGMKFNVFDQAGSGDPTALMHADFIANHRAAIFSDAESCGSLRKAFNAHYEQAFAHADDAFGVKGIDVFFEDAKMVGEPSTIDRDQEWVSKFMGKSKHVPFGRLRSAYFDVTADEARALGYVKGNLKKEEIIEALTRETDVTTIYKKQKFHRDDLIDCTLNMIVYIKKEMRSKLDEEVARAGLLGDGRPVGSQDKINETKIIPIYKDTAIYAPKYSVVKGSSDTDATMAQKFIETIIRNRKDYKGTGNPTLFTTEDMVASLLLLKDLNGHFIYKSISEIATVLRVSEIVTVPVFDGITRETTENSKTYNNDLVAILVNPIDYTYGSRSGGEVNFFSDFDIDYNHEKYLIETRCSGMLVKPYSAQVFEFKSEKVGG